MLKNMFDLHRKRRCRTYGIRVIKDPFLSQKHCTHLDRGIPADMFGTTSVQHRGGVCQYSPSIYAMGHGADKATRGVSAKCTDFLDGRALSVRLICPRIQFLSPQERAILHNLVKQDDLRGQALFALGYWVGCRVVDLTHLLLEHTHVGGRSGWLHLGESSEKVRDIDLVNEARGPLHAYLQKRSPDESSPYVFTSQRSPRLSEAGLHHWFRSLRQQAPPDEQAVIATISFHDLRDDFASRALSAGWTLEEIAYYLGHITLRGTPAVQTTIRYTQMTRAQVKEKL